MAHVLPDIALISFAEHLRREEKSAATIEKYCSTVAAFTRSLNGRPVDREAIVSYKESLISSGLSPATINAHISALNGLFDFFGWTECRTGFLKVQRRVFRDSCRELTRDDYERLIRAAKAHGRTRLTLIMEAICATGIRVSEVCYLTVEAAKTGSAQIRLKGKIRTILLPSKLCRKLLKYAGTQKTASGEIFLTRSGKRLNRCQIWAEMKRLCDEAGVESSKVFPHNLRHLFATTFYRVTRDIAKLADVLGHSSIEPPRIYLITSGAEHARTLNRLGLVS